MNTERTDITGELDGAGLRVIVWDDVCRACNGIKRVVERYAVAKGYRFLPLREWLQLNPGASPDGMYVVTGEGRVLFGVDAALHVAGLVWWLRPVEWQGRIGWIHGLLARFYRWFAAHRRAFGCVKCGGGSPSCSLPRQ